MPSPYLKILSIFGNLVPLKIEKYLKNLKKVTHEAHPKPTQSPHETDTKPVLSHSANFTTKFKIITFVVSKILPHIPVSDILYCLP